MSDASFIVANVFSFSDRLQLMFLSGVMTTGEQIVIYDKFKIKKR